MAAPTMAEDIAVLKNQMITVNSQLSSISKKLDDGVTMFLPRTEFDEWKKGQNYQKVLLALIVAIVSAVITAIGTIVLTKG